MIELTAQLWVLFWGWLHGFCTLIELSQRANRIFRRDRNSLYLLCNHTKLYNHLHIKSGKWEYVENNRKKFTSKSVEIHCIAKFLGEFWMNKWIFGWMSSGMLKICSFSRSRLVVIVWHNYASISASYFTRNVDVILDFTHERWPVIFLLALCQQQHAMLCPRILEILAH